MRKQVVASLAAFVAVLANAGEVPCDHYQVQGGTDFYAFSPNQACAALMSAVGFGGSPDECTVGAGGVDIVFSGRQFHADRVASETCPDGNDPPSFGDPVEVPSTDAKRLLYLQYALGLMVLAAVMLR